LDLFASTGEPPRTPRTRKRGGFGGTLVALGGIVLLVAVALGVVVVEMLSRRGPATSSGGGFAGEIRKADLIFALRKPPEPWVADSSAQNAIGANVLAFQRAEPSAWVALSVRDFGTRDPLPSDLREKVRTQLEKGFDHVPADLTAEPVEWAGRKAERYSFRAVYRPTGEACVGDYFVLGSQGVGYWFCSWCPENAALGLADELAGIRDGFRLLDERTNWEPTAVAERIIRGNSAEVPYQLTDYERVWATPKLKTPADEDPKADLLLEGLLKTQGRGDAKPRAEVVVMVLDGGDLKAARRYVEARYKKLYEGSGNEINFEELTGEPDGEPMAVVPSTPETPVAGYKLTIGGADPFRSADKLIVLSAIESGGKTVIVEASCPWKERAIWERRLAQLAGSLKAGQGQ
jgi:hypothetical protein